MSDEQKKTVKKISKDEAMELMADWADAVELDSEGDLFKAVANELYMAVRLNKLSFDEETEEFTYNLSSPVTDSKNQAKSIITIRSISMEDKKILEKYNQDEGVKGTVALIAKYTGLTTSMVSQLKDRDITRINAITTGFFMQQLPGEKKR